jgi:hypothetical protein
MAVAVTGVAPVGGSPLSPGKEEEEEEEEEEECEAVGEKGRKEKVVAALELGLPPIAAASPAGADAAPAVAAVVGVMDEREGGSITGRVVGGEELGPRVAPMEEEEEEEEEEVLRRAMPSSEEEEVEVEVEMEAEVEVVMVRGVAPLVEVSR